MWFSFRRQRKLQHLLLGLCTGICLCWKLHSLDKWQLHCVCRWVISLPFCFCFLYSLHLISLHAFMRHTKASNHSNPFWIITNNWLFQPGINVFTLYSPKASLRSWSYFSNSKLEHLVLEQSSFWSRDGFQGESSRAISTKSHSVPDTHTDTDTDTDTHIHISFSGGLGAKESSCNPRDLGSISG